MRTKPAITIADARQMIAAARAEAEKNQWNVTIAVVDDGGHLIALERMDGAMPKTAEIAFHKAHSAAVMRMPTKTLEDLAKDRPGVLTMPGVIRVQGGLPIKIGADCLGGVGVSGVASHQDEQVAAAGIASLPATLP